MSPHLLDADVLIALTIEEHEHHDAVATWSSETDLFALCPIVEGALTRFLIRLGESPATPRRLLQQLHASPRFTFWPDALSYADVALDRVHGHRQVTDAYLIALAASRQTRLATLDSGLAAEHPKTAMLIPT